METSASRPRSDADRLTCAAEALIAIMRVCPNWWLATTAKIDAKTGMLCLEIDDQCSASTIATRIGLPAGRYITELDGGRLLKKWSGTWAGCHVTIWHQFTPSDTALTSAGGAR